MAQLKGVRFRVSGDRECVLMKNVHQSIGLILAPIVFVLLWSGGYAVAKIGIKYAEPITLLVWRYFFSRGPAGSVLSRIKTAIAQTEN
jgi:hypothetical protein